MLTQNSNIMDPTGSMESSAVVEMPEHSRYENCNNDGERSCNQFEVGVRDVWGNGSMRLTMRC